MLLRIWHCGYDRERLDELNEFAKTRATPMFDSFAGCMGHLFSHDDDEYLAVSMWIGRHAIGQAERSDICRETATALDEMGILRGEPRVDVFEIDALNLGWNSRRPRPEDEDYDD